MCSFRKSTSGAWVLRPKALSLRSMVWRLGSLRHAVRREERAGGISERRREVKMSAKLAVSRWVWVERMGARCSQAGAPRVLPPRWIEVNFLDSIRVWMWGWMSEALSRRREEVERVKWVGVLVSRGSPVSLEFLKGVGLLASGVAAMMIRVYRIYFALQEKV